MRMWGELLERSSPHTPTMKFIKMARATDGRPFASIYSLNEQGLGGSRCGSVSLTF